MKDIFNTVFSKRKYGVSDINISDRKLKLYNRHYKTDKPCSSYVCCFTSPMTLTNIRETATIHVTVFRRFIILVILEAVLIISMLLDKGSIKSRFIIFYLRIKFYYMCDCRNTFPLKGYKW